MGIRKNGKEISAVYRGGTAIQAIYRGARLVWQAVSSIWTGYHTWKGKEIW